MKKEITMTVWCCDICGSRGNYNGTCRICEKEHCGMCTYIGYNPLNIDICRNHQNDSNMKEVLQSYSKNIDKLKEDIVVKIKKVVICSNLENNNDKKSK